MKHRAVGAVLFGGGVLLLALAAGLVFVVKPAMTKLPYDLDPSTSVAEAKGATFLQITNGAVAINQADLASTVQVTPERDKTAALSGDLAGDSVVWQVGQTVERTDTKALVSAYGAELALDRVSGAAVEWNEQFLDESGTPEKISFAGQVYKFPFNAAQGNYEVFDRDLRQTRMAEFKGTEDVDGLEAYRYEQVITDEKLPLATDRVALLLGALAPGATSGEVVYSNTRTVWVDPVTGSYVNVREQQKKVLVPNVGTPVTLLDADFSYNEETVSSSVERAKESRGQLNLLGVFAPLGLAVLGLVLIIVALLVSRSRTPARPAAHAAPARAAQPAAAAPAADPTPTRVDQPVVRDDERAAGPLTDEIPPASTNWKSDEPTVPSQRPAQDESEKK
ncbi:Protein of unknown function [Micromonospora phaseoli]|uniref:DUF3068 domain-containing protein n=1 Tax=Micromonospora phaseoli TaxID=1144548 RepID=A0A1H7DEZ9_9ACTN|nr:DUF3068 domain-containing protein [Micromonospora phaseoli]PZV90475.1 Protein of unknown function (DUF3068) [Micromonospora phaseoli]GIJ78133.1 hypothetical protein Xph01_25650 [Micromonospora phaseoli]SEK00268.1 Protein of unknown function [Micromonospora phaseoli]